MLNKYTFYKIIFIYLGSYNARCNTAATSFNYGPSFLSHIHKKVTNISPGIFTKKYIKKKETSREKLSKKRLNFDKNRLLFTNFIIVMIERKINKQL